jgi:hypothetical protein
MSVQGDWTGQVLLWTREPGHPEGFLATQLRRANTAKYNRLYVIVFVETPLCPNGMAYRRAHGSCTPGFLKNPFVIRCVVAEIQRASWFTLGLLL